MGQILSFESDRGHWFLIHVCPPEGYLPRPPVLVELAVGETTRIEIPLQRDWGDFRIFAGSESFLLQTMRHGGAGCISATANINPAAIDALYREWQSENADRLQESLNVVRNVTQSYPMIPALKSIIADFGRLLSPG